MDILKIPNAKEYATFKEAQAALAALGGKGVIIAAQNTHEDWKKFPAAGNFATFFGTYWEFANHGDSTPGRMIYHSPNLPPGFDYIVFIVVPAP
jgi:hypothetical protein